MIKDIIFLVTDEIDYLRRLAIAEQILDQKILLVHGEKTILDSFKKCHLVGTSDQYVLIDGDNVLLAGAKEALDSCVTPTVFYTTNEYGIIYGHGGVKVISRSSNLEFSTVVDVTAKLNLCINHSVLSIHDFGFSEFNKWKTIFKELVKLFLWGNKELLRRWLNHPVPLAIFRTDVRDFLKSATLDTIESTIKSKENLQIIYEHSRYRGYMQKRT
jgi:hypothetical protein